MTSKTSSTKGWSELREIYCWSVKKSLGMTALLAVLLFLALPTVLLFSLANANIRTDEMTLAAYSVQQQYENIVGNIAFRAFSWLAVPVCLVFVLVLTVQLFGYMHNKRSVDLVHALPVRRSAMLLGRLLSGLTTLFAPLLLNVGITAIIVLCFDVANKGAYIANLFIQMLGLFLMLTAAMLFCILMAVCTGTTLDMVLSVLGVNMAYPLLVYLSVYMVQCLLPGFASPGAVSATIATALSPFSAAFFLSNYINASSKEVTGFLAWWVFFTVFLALSCVYLYRRRKSEAAESHLAYRIPKGVIRFLVTAVGGFGLGFILFWVYSSTANFLTGVLLGSLAAHIIVEAIYSRGFSRMKRSFGGYAAFLGAFIVFYGVVCTGAFGFVERVPALEDIESVRFTDYTHQQTFGSDDFYVKGEKFETLAYREPELSQKENLEAVRGFHQMLVEHQKQSGFPYRMGQQEWLLYHIDYHLKNGSTLSRTYYYNRQAGFQVPDDALKEAVARIVNAEEYKTSGNLLFYLEPSEISRVQVQNYDREAGTASVTYQPGDGRKQELLEAMCRDALDMDVTQESVSGNGLGFSVVLQSGEREDDEWFKPEEGGKLRAMVGDYSGKISVPMPNYYLSEEQTPHTWAFLQEQGWLPAES